MEILDEKLPVMVFPVHLLRLAVVAIVNYPCRGLSIGALSPKQAALQSTWLFRGL
jgi:hypothetical protein